MTKKNDYSRLGFDRYDSGDLRILMSLDTKEKVREWLDAVGPRRTRLCNEPIRNSRRVNVT